MKIVIIGSGIVGLSIVKMLVDKKIFAPKEILVLDKYSIPSKGTSIRNSGVLHAGLYYKPGSLKAKLSIEGGTKLKYWCKDNKIDILECGKLLIPFNNVDLINLDKIEKNALKNGCDIKVIDFQDAKKIQPGIIKKEKYIWSPKTCVFNPGQIIDNLYQYLKENGVNFLNKSVKFDDFEKKQLILNDGGKVKYIKYINCAGPGALNIAKSVSDKFNHLSIVPFIGQYGVQKSGLSIKTNLYPVPDPELPFLGIHITPRIRNSSLIGPNALPILKKDIQGFDKDDMKDIPSILVNNLILFTSNKNNFREHSLSELSINIKDKFYRNAIKFFTDENKSNFSVEMDSSTYGIRPQLINRFKYEFINDFIYEKIDNNIHIVNAVSPAFTSSFALAEFIIKRFIN